MNAVAMLLCLNCGKECEESPRATCCPNCGDTGVPANASERLDVKITWHELRVIVMWAERFASSVAEERESKKMMRVVYGIADRIQQQHLSQKTGLTFASEIAELRAEFGDVEQNVVREIPICESQNGEVKE